MPKKVYGVKGYEDRGKEFQRTTDREYSHAVVVRRLDNGYEFVEGYCGREDLARKLQGTVYNRFANLDKSVTVEICETYRIK